MDNIPWVEKYRPNNFDNIILNNENKLLFNEILNKNIFPNILLYGPPGTGKTTTIINVINKYQKINDQQDKSLIIHLNASDDRGIDIIRNNISQFVNSDNLFTKGTKFIILDEVDYMTKNAQLALKQLIKINNANIRYCLICNYISRIDESLLDEFIVVRFNQLPENNIIEFLDNINKNEKLKMTKDTILNIKNLYNSDIRSMINYMQNNINNNKIETLTDNFFNELFIIHTTKSFNIFSNCLYNKSKNLLIDYNIILKKYITFLITKKQKIVIERNIKNDLQFIYYNINSKKSINFLYYLLSNK
tara:strand:+ start:345 stop:1259 length:915 start_codon:yes stop_codon:yes gene_type:complete